MVHGRIEMYIQRCTVVDSTACTENDDAHNPNLITEVYTIMPTMTKPRPTKYSTLEKELASQRDELRARLGERQKSVFIEREPDDEIADAYESAARDMMITTLERERKTLNEIERAQASMKSGNYGVCAVCAATIPEARLRALPWARTCVNCAVDGLSSRASNGQRQCVRSRNHSNEGGYSA